MMHLLWFIPLVVGLVSMWWVKLQGLAVLVALICGLIGLYQLVMGTRGIPLHAATRNEIRATSSETCPRGRLTIEPLPAGFKLRHYQAPASDLGRRESRL